MEGYLAFLFLLMSSPFVAFLLHVICARAIAQIKPGLSPLPVAALSVALGYPVMGFGIWIFHLRHLPLAKILYPSFYALIVYTCLAFCYFILFTMSETARRIHILRQLHENGSVSLPELTASYDAGEMLSVRLDRMVALKQLKRVRDRYFLEAKLLWIAGCGLSFWARLLKFSNKERA